MRFTLLVLATAATLGGVAACHDQAAPESKGWEAGIVATDDLPEYGADRIWRYHPGAVDADSLFELLLRQEVPVVEAWEPVEDVCQDPLGPRFTVVVESAEPDLARWGFERGNGIRACTRTVRRLVP